MADDSCHDDTPVGHVANRPAENPGILIPPVHHASTVLFATLANMERSLADVYAPGHVHYGRSGTPTTFTIEDAVAALEGADRHRPAVGPRRPSPPHCLRAMVSASAIVTAGRRRHRGARLAAIRT